MRYRSRRQRNAMAALAALMCASALIRSVEGADPPQQPKIPAPRFEMASAMEKDGIVVVRFFRPEVGTKDVEVDGKKVVQEVQRTVELEFPVDGKSIRLLSPNGKAITLKDLAQRQAKPTLVAVFAFNKDMDDKNLTPDPAYLRLLRDDVVVIAATYDKFGPPHATYLSPREEK